ncbi:HindVP family restriction endonuclease [Geminocystis herdmanii]|uniref:HindVP family restriction endonuclease n=1 Tax=Geminocystis herdmanii TaxID=669359 RepID=UPI000346DBE8|nr:HindVP family restriction endonuclease [Geminocystis herdmanii]
MNQIKPSLFGIRKSNRDFTLKETWGKNQFNSSFPISLSCYLDSKNIDAINLCIQEKKFCQSTIAISEIFGLKPTDNDIYYAFESTYTPYQKYIIGSLPRIDLVIQKESDGQCLSALEIKLTALPDNVTCNLQEEYYGSEIVVRPDTIVYLACSIISSLNGELGDIIPDIVIDDWSQEKLILSKIDQIIDCIEQISYQLAENQQSFLIQPIWKTRGKSPSLAENCLDVFVWSNAGFTYFISTIANREITANSINRQTRTAIWLYKMLQDFKNHRKFNHKKIIDNLSYNTKNDKAFASSGNITNKYMMCDRLTKPIIKKDEIKNIILGGSQNLLSPERRFDAIVFNSPDLFR